ncbi:MAG: M24 family metallopeptidase [Chitinophagaceae bacterium]
MKRFHFSLFLALFFLGAASQEIPSILSLKERARVQDELLMDRFENLLPSLMREQGMDMWLVIGREYNEDPVLKTMLPSTWLNARRRTILLFFDRGNQRGLERIAVARYDVGKLFKGAWNPEEEPNQWKRLAALISERAPRKIGLNYSPEFAHADGITKTEYDSLVKYLSVRQKSSITSAEKLAVDWLQIRSEKELKLYDTISRIAHDIIEEAFSEKVIKPGITTTEDVVWWMREKVAELKLETWFHPTVDVQRGNPGEGDSQRSFSQQPAADVIQFGDLLHCDFGISYLKLNTDVQQLAYVLKPQETDAPESLKNGIKTGNKLQDIVTAYMHTAKTGNQVLKESLQKAKDEGIVATIYSHPIGFHGHAAGPAIGMWDMQSGVPGSGEYFFKNNTAYAIELNAKVFILEWNKEIRIMLEEQAVLKNNSVYYIDGRQKKILLIPRNQNHLSQ